MPRKRAQTTEEKLARIVQWGTLRERQRARAVIIVQSEGGTEGDAAEELGITRMTIRRWLELYRRGGVNLLIRKRRVGKRPLAKAKKLEICRLLLGRYSETPPASLREIARRTKVSHSTVFKINAKLAERIPLKQPRSPCQVQLTMSDVVNQGWLVTLR